MGWLSSIPILSTGGSVLGFSISLLAAALMLGLWVLGLMIVHPLHAILFIAAALLEYLLIYFFGFDLWVCFFSFFGFYVGLFALYYLVLRRLIPLPANVVKELEKLAALKEDEMLSEEEYKAAKKKLLKL